MWSFKLAALLLFFIDPPCFPPGADINVWKVGDECELGSQQMLLASFAQKTH